MTVARLEGVPSTRHVVEPSSEVELVAWLARAQPAAPEHPIDPGDRAETQRCAQTGAFFRRGTIVAQAGEPQAQGSGGGGDDRPAAETGDAIARLILGADPGHFVASLSPRPERIGFRGPPRDR